MKSKNYIIAIFSSIIIFTSIAFADQLSDLVEEFNKRDAILLSPQQSQVINFLTNLEGFSYEIREVVKLEVFPQDSNNFILQTESGDVCLGNIRNEIVRCKNQMGLTVVISSGDSD